MFQWAQATFDKLSQHVAPPPEDGPGRFAYCVQRGDEDAAMGCIAGMDPAHTLINQAKGQYPIHLACQYSCQRLLDLLLKQPGVNVQQIDLVGNTPLHYASMSTASNGLDVVKFLITNYGASVVAKNSMGQTPYDVATLNSIRQHLLPIQLQAETQAALDNGGQGLPAGIDLGGLRIKNSAMPPPPTFGGGPPSNAAAGAIVPATTTDNPSQASQLPPAPSSREYSRVGSSSAALGGKYRADGFHSSSSDVSLQKKYGHATVGTYNNIPPPPSSGNSVGASPAGGAANPFAAGGRYGARRYVAYGQVAAPAPATYSFAPSTMSAPSSFGAPVHSPSSFANPAQEVVPTATQHMTTSSSSTPTSHGAPTTPYMPPPPYQSHTIATDSHYAQTSVDYSQQYPSADSALPHAPNSAPVVYQHHQSATPFHHHHSQNSANLADANAEDVFTAPSPQKEVPPTQSNPHADADTEPAATNTETGVTDWVEAVDPSSGHTYYYNTVTHETSWEKPASLPENWVEATDPTSGQVYYYNTVTNETSWEKPSIGETQVSNDSSVLVTPISETATDTFASSAPLATTSEPSSSAMDAFSSPPRTTAPESLASDDVTSPVNEPGYLPSETAFSSPSRASASDTFTYPAPPSTNSSDIQGLVGSLLSAPVVSAVDAFSAPPPATATVATTTTSPFQAPPVRTLSADELFAEDAPQDDIVNPPSPKFDTPQKAPPVEELSTEELDGDGTLDDIPLSPDLQRPITDSIPVDAASAEPSGAATPMDSNSADSLFAAIGMPPPPFSARKR